MKDYILEARDLVYEYADGTRALNQINMGIEKGQKVAILGPNGAGKSTLFLHFNGIKKPAGGQILFKGECIKYSAKDLAKLRSQVGIVFQDPDEQLFSASVFQEVSFGPMNMDLDRKQVEERVVKALEETNTYGLRYKPTHFLSYGQKKRVSIADILAMTPEVIVLDEPTASLDPKHVQKIMDLLTEINRKGTTVIISTHDINLAYEWADRIFVMADGTVKSAGTPDEVFANHKLMDEIGMENPWIVEMHLYMKELGLIDQNAPFPADKEAFKRQIASVMGKRI